MHGYKYITNDIFILTIVYYIAECVESECEASHLTNENPVCCLVILSVCKKNY